MLRLLSILMYSLVCTPYGAAVTLYLWDKLGYNGVPAMLLGSFTAYLMGSIIGWTEHQKKVERE